MVHSETNHAGPAAAGGFSTAPSETALRTLAQYAPFGIFEADAAGGLVYLSPAAVEIAGNLSDHTVAGWGRMIHAEDRDAVLAGWWDTVARKAPWEHEYRLLRPDGRVVWVRVVVVPIRDPAGTVTGFVGSVHDITAGKRADQRLRDGKAYFRDLLDHLPVIVWTCRTDGYCTFLNQRWTDVTGQERTDGADHGWQTCVHPDDQDQIKQAFRDAVPRREGFQLEYRLRQASGGYAWVLDSGMPRFDADGAFIGFIGAVADISDRKAAEEILRTARETAEQADRSKTQFLAAASHDLRQPLNAMSLLLVPLEKEIASDRGRFILDRLRDGISAEGNLLNALLDISKLDAGGVEPQYSEVQVSRLFHQVAADYLGDAASRGLGLRFVPSREVLCTDPILIERILRNLVENAVRYTATGRILVGCRRRPGHRLRIDVVDTGPGIAAEDLDTIFEEFHQLGNPQRSRQDGHGLGLAIVRRTARSLDHPLEVRSVVGKGSRFSVEIPLVGRPVAEIPPPEPAEPPAIETCDVLVVEDDPLVNEAMQWVLRDLGCTVLAVTSGDEVEAALEDMTPDLVIADFRLPGDRNGVDVITAVRRRLGRPVPACIITGDVSDAVRTLTEAAGVEWLSKPIRPEDLSRQVEQACCSKVICSEQT